MNPYPPMPAIGTHWVSSTGANLRWTVEGIDQYMGQNRIKLKRKDRPTVKRYIFESGWPAELIAEADWDSA